MFTRTIPAAVRVRFLQGVGLVVSLPLLSVAVLAGPALADRGGPPLPPAANPAATVATSQDPGGGPPPRPPADPPAEQARVPGTLPGAQAVPPPPSSGGARDTGSPTAQGPRTAGVAGVEAVEAPVADTTAGERVVVCKYVRKPFVAEVAHHIVIVNEQALVGRGFTGSFPWAFSDGQFHSVAIRFAKAGEQAHEVSLGSCPRQSGGPTPVPTQPGATEPGAVEPPEATVRPPVRVEPETPAPSRRGALPQTGAPTGLESLLLLSSAALLGGVALRLRRRSVPGA